MKKIMTLILAACMILSTAGCYKYEEDSYEKVDNKLKKYLLINNYAQAKGLMQQNPWYTVKDKEISEKLMQGFDVYKVDEQTWLPVIERIDESIDADIKERKHEIFYQKGLHHFNLHLNREELKEILESYWGKCSEGSKGYGCYLATKEILNGEYVTAGKLFSDHLSEKELKDNFEYDFIRYHEDTEVKDLQDYLERVYCAACIAGFKPSSTLDRFEEPGDDYQPDKRFVQNEEREDGKYAYFLMPSNIRKSLKREMIEKANGNKVMVINRIDRISDDKNDLYIDGYLMRNLPSDYCAETVEDVGYILLMDYGYKKDGKWYAGTVQATLYDVKNTEPIYTSKTLNAQYDTYYFGEPTDYIFSYYPDVTNIVKEALTAIKETTNN